MLQVDGVRYAAKREEIHFSSDSSKTIRIAPHIAEAVSLKSVSSSRLCKVIACVGERKTALTPCGALPTMAFAWRRFAR